MEVEDGTAVEPRTPTTPPSVVAESRLSPAGPSTSPSKVAGDEEGQGQVKIPGGGGDDGVVGADERAGAEQADVGGAGKVAAVVEGREEGAVDNEGEDINLKVSDGGTSTGDEDDPGDMNYDDKDNSDGESSSSTSSESSGGLAGELHPMKNPVILANLFELCPPSLLANFRLVCKEWRDLSLAAWRSHVRVKVEQDLSGDIEVRLGCNKVTVSLAEFLEYVETPKNQCLLKPFRRFILDGRFPFPIEEHKSSWIRKLWELVKRDATSLELYNCFFPEVEVFKEVIYESCPNLKLLKLMFCAFPKLSEKGWNGKAPVKVYPEQINLQDLSIKMDVFPFPLPEILPHFPSLANLFFVAYKSLDEHGGFPPYKMLDLYRVIQTIRKQDPRKLPLKQLYINPCFDISNNINQACQVFHLHRELSLPFPTLKLRMGSEDEAKLHELAGAAEIDCRPLRRLTFYRNRTDDGTSIWKFPFTEPLDNLEELTLTRVIWENMEFLKLLPNLDTLEVTDIDGSVIEVPHDNYESVPVISNTDWNMMADIELLKMRVLEWNYSLTEDELRRLISWFPNLKNLSVVLNDKLFAIVCEHWPDLDSLTVMGSELTDEGITGLRAGQIVDDTMDLPPNIKLLQNLESFYYWESGKLTEVSVFNGLLKLPRLETLYLGETTGLTENSKAALEEKNIELFDWA